AGEIPFLAQPRRHAGAEAEAAEQFIFEAVLLHQIKIFAAGGMAPHENRLWQMAFDQRFDRFRAHPEGVNRQAVSELGVAWNLTDDEFGPALGDRRPGLAAV